MHPLRRKRISPLARPNEWSIKGWIKERVGKFIHTVLMCLMVDLWISFRICPFSRRKRQNQKSCFLRSTMIHVAGPRHFALRRHALASILWWCMNQLETPWFWLLDCNCFSCGSHWCNLYCGSFHLKVANFLVLVFSKVRETGPDWGGWCFLWMLVPGMVAQSTKTYWFPPFIPIFQSWVSWYPAYELQFGQGDGSWLFLRVGLGVGLVQRKIWRPSFKLGVRHGCSCFALPLLRTMSCLLFQVWLLFEFMIWSDMCLVLFIYCLLNYLCTFIYVSFQLFFL